LELTLIVIVIVWYEGQGGRSCRVRGSSDY